MLQYPLLLASSVGVYAPVGGEMLHLSLATIIYVLVIYVLYTLTGRAGSNMPRAEVANSGRRLLAKSYLACKSARQMCPTCS